MVRLFSKRSNWLRQMDSETLPTFFQSVEELLAQTGLCRPESIQKADELADLVAAVQATLSLYSPEIYSADPDSLLQDLTAGKAGGFLAAWAWCTKPSYRRARAAIIALRKAGKAKPSQLFTEVSAATGQLRKWQSQSTSQNVPIEVSKADTHPRTDCRSDLAAKTCAPWRSACSSSTPVTEVCDSERCRSRSAGGVALPQPGERLLTGSAKWHFHYFIGLISVFRARVEPLLENIALRQ